MTYEENRMHKELIALKTAALVDALIMGTVHDEVKTIISLIDAKIDFAKAELRDHDHDSGGQP